MKTPSSQQLGFSIEGERFALPRSILNQPSGEDLIKILKENQLFEERQKKGSVLLISLTDDLPKATIYDPSNWQAQNQNPENLINPNYCALIIVAHQVIPPYDLFYLIGANKEKLNFNGGQIFILENNLSFNSDELPLIKEPREKILKDLGFIKIRIFPPTKEKKGQPIKTLLTQARLKKIAEHHSKPVDLLTPRPNDPPWKKKWRESLIPGILAKYRQIGFAEIDVSEIEERLRNSTNPPSDLAKAQDGFGVEAKAPCSCHIKVGLDGTFTVLNHCQDHPDGFPTPKKLPIKKPQTFYKVKEVETNQKCGDCGANIIQSVRRINSYPNGKTAIQIDLSCSHCGLLSTKREYVSTKQIIE